MTSRSQSHSRRECSTVMPSSLDRRVAGWVGHDVALPSSGAARASTRQKAASAPYRGGRRSAHSSGVGNERAMGTSTAGVFGAGTAAPLLVVSSYTLGTEVAFEDRVRAAAA